MERSKSVQENSQTPNSRVLPEEIERKARVDAIWQQMNKGVSAKSIKSMLEMHSSTVNKSSRKNSSQTSSAGWMGYLGLGSKKTPTPGQGIPDKPPSITQNGTSEDAKRHAAAALAAVKDAAGLATAGRGKVEVTEVRDFAGEEIEVKKLVDAASKEAVDKGKTAAGAISAVDAVLEQLKKKPKLSVLDKTKKDWGEFKDVNTGMEDELDAYKKSSNQYLDKVSFLQRTDYREFERERDARLAAQAKRKVDMRDD
ncbi:craniofacial development protein 1 [Dorcoceras hygrometricum]|uniref:Craniofacial development protein 1 n=1 Tax=Dorcoceras hygrometricum TaxID=472368 RepID=A0A2Z7DHB2_9LAMI|nr:craniofacial development protein 1 [Dorcoceras hygrometricum]